MNIKYCPSLYFVKYISPEINKFDCIQYDPFKIQINGYNHCICLIVFIPFQKDVAINTVLMNIMRFLLL